MISGVSGRGRSNSDELGAHSGDRQNRHLARLCRWGLGGKRNSDLLLRWSQASTRDFVRHVLEFRVLAQHVYWSVGRGLADARARGKTILRLRVALEDGGMEAHFNIYARLAPVPTPDRLETALSLAKECELLPA